MKRLFPVCIVVASCSGSNRDVKPPTPAPRPAPVVSNAPTAPTAPPRTCQTATFAGAVGHGVEIYEIGSDCTARVISTIETDGSVFDIAWPRRDLPLAIATADEGAYTAEYILVYDQPLADEATRAQPRRIVPTGKGATEPEGWEFGLASDSGSVFVERCTSWDDGGGGGEESEEWDCKQHIYFRLDDKAGKKAKRINGAPRGAFEPAFTGGAVPGTGVALALGRDGVSCTVDGNERTLQPWGWAAHGTAPLTIVPVSATDYLLGVDINGGRMAPAKGILYERMHNCDDGKALYGRVVAGPAPYWAEDPNDDNGTWSGWRIHIGDAAFVVDAAGQAELALGELTWTQPQP